MLKKTAAVLIAMISLLCLCAGCDGAEVTAIEVTPPVKLEYVVGDMLDLDGLKVLALTDSGRRELPSGEYIIAPSPDEPLTQETTHFTVAYTVGERTYTDTFDITVWSELPTTVVEAETARSDSSTLVIEKPSVLTNTGSGYSVGGLRAGDMLSFDFSAMDSGVINLALVLSSAYLVETLSHDSWTPVRIGDVQLSKICDIYFNGSKLGISEELIIQGSYAEDGSDDLWYNWQTLDIGDVYARQGNNTLVLHFKAHDYTDVAAIAAAEGYGGSFAANVDALYVTPIEQIFTIRPCTISPAEQPLDSQSVAADSIEIQDRDGLPAITFDLSYSFVSGGYVDDALYDSLIAAEAAARACRFISSTYCALVRLSDGEVIYGNDTDSDDGCNIDVGVVASEGIAEVSIEISAVAAGSYAVYFASQYNFLISGDDFVKVLYTPDYVYTLSYSAAGGGLTLEVEAA